MSFNIAMARQGYVTAHKNLYTSSSAHLYWGAALITIGLGFIIAGVFMSQTELLAHNK